MESAEEKTQNTYTEKARGFYCSREAKSSFLSRGDSRTRAPTGKKEARNGEETACKEEKGTVGGKGTLLKKKRLLEKGRHNSFASKDSTSRNSGKGERRKNKHQKERASKNRHTERLGCLT